jgi:tripartite-type tricarboxylate transporter receptor subunit TctC
VAHDIALLRGPDAGVHQRIAADYPNKPIRWILGFAPGGAPDVIARVDASSSRRRSGSRRGSTTAPARTGVLGRGLVAKVGARRLHDARHLDVVRGEPERVQEAALSMRSGASRRCTNLCSSPGMLILVNASYPAQTVQQLIEIAKKPGHAL